MKILVACEYSGIVRDAFIKKGHDAVSCDILPSDRPGPHLQCDVIPLLKKRWDFILAFPPCTYLTVTGNRWFDVNRYGEAALKRISDREKAVEFFMYFVHANADKIVIENPIGIMSTRYRRPDQIIHPFMFGEPERKSTCLWLKGVPELKATKEVKPNLIKYKTSNKTDSLWHMRTSNLPPKERQKARSITYKGIAKAMANQWG